MPIIIISCIYFNYIKINTFVYCMQYFLANSKLDTTSFTYSYCASLQTFPHSQAILMVGLGTHGPLFPIRLHNIYTYKVYACTSGASPGAHGKFKMAKLEALARQHHAVLCLSIHDSTSKVNRLGGDVQVISCHHYLVVFHPFVEQLTFFHRPRSPCHCAMESPSGTCQKVHKLCINPLQNTYKHTSTTSD